LEDKAGFDAVIDWKKVIEVLGSNPEMVVKR
jgi:hypothetical protein